MNCSQKLKQNLNYRSKLNEKFENKFTVVVVVYDVDF